MIVLNQIKKIFNKKNKIKEENFYSGSINKKDEICPSYINMQNPKYIEIDNLFYSGLMVTNY